MIYLNEFHKKNKLSNFLIVCFLCLFLLAIIGNLSKFGHAFALPYKEDQNNTIVSGSATASLLSGSYTGTVAINEPLALGVLDIALTLTDTNGALTGVLNDSGTLAYPSATTLQGNITTSSGITPTFRIDAAPFTSMVSGRQVTRSFRIDGSTTEDGNVLKGFYTETISGFTPQALIVNGMFLASRAAPVQAANIPNGTPTATPIGGASPTATPVSGVTPIPGSKRVYLPVISNKKGALGAAGVETAPVATATPTPEPTTVSREAGREGEYTIYLPLVSQ